MGHVSIERLSGDGEAMTDCQSDRPEQGDKSTGHDNGTVSQSAGGEISTPAPADLQVSQVAQLHGSNAVGPVRSAFSYFTAPAVFGSVLVAPFVIAWAMWLFASEPRLDPAPQQVAPPAGSAEQSQPQKSKEAQDRPRPDRTLKDIAATWPLPLATIGFESPAQHPLQTQRSVPSAGTRQARTHRSNPRALALNPQHTNDQSLTSYGASAPIRYPCLSPFITIMTPVELIVCGIAPLVLSPIALPPQPPPVLQALPRAEQPTSDRSIY